MNRQPRGKMSKTKWWRFLASVVGVLIFITLFLHQKGVFEEANAVIFGIVGVVMALIALGLYFYVRDLPDDLD